MITMNWAAAEELLYAGEHVQYRLSDKQDWETVRVSGDEMQRQVGTTWVTSEFAYSGLRKSEWRRVPVDPSAAELPLFWMRAHPSNSPYDGAMRDASRALEAALKRDDLASLKDVEIARLKDTYADAYQSTEGSNETRDTAGWLAVLHYLRIRGKT